MPRNAPRYAGPTRHNLKNTLNRATISFSDDFNVRAVTLISYAEAFTRKSPRVLTAGGAFSQFLFR